MSVYDEVVYKLNVLFQLFWVRDRVAEKPVHALSIDEHVQGVCSPPLLLEIKQDKNK